MSEEKILTVNLRKDLVKVSRWKRTKDYSRLFRQLMKRKFKTEKVKIDGKLNEKIWKRGIENPPLKIRVKVLKQDDGIVKVGLME